MKKRSVTTIQIILLVAVLYVILLAGLNPGGCSLQNNVTWLTEQAGIKFGKYGIAFTRPFISAAQAEKFKSTGFTIEIALNTAVPQGGRFMFIALIHNGDDHAQLLLGQWRNYIIIMNGDDYSHKRNTSRLYMDTSMAAASTFIVTVSTKDSWTKIYLDGKLIQTGKNVALHMPAGPRQGRLIFGNSVHGRYPWNGAIHGFAMYRGIISDNVIKQHYSQWLGLQDFSFAKSEDPYLLYLFNEKNGSIVLDYSKHNTHLEIPSVLALVERESFVLPFSRLGLRQIYFQDVAINLIGFLPFGFILAAIVYGSEGISRRNSLLIVVAAGFILSFGIELLQSWMPSRSSSLLDLLLNTTGSYIGALSFVFFCKKRILRKSPDSKLTAKS